MRHFGGRVADEVALDGSGMFGSRTGKSVWFPAIVVAAGMIALPGGPAPGAQSTSAVIAVDGLTLRSAPNEGSRVLRRLGILTEVVLLRRAGKPATINGRADRWVHVQANYCPDPDDKSPHCETLVERGWLAESYLAYDERFEPVSQWRAGSIEGRSGNVSWTYRIAADGSFTFDHEAWEYAGKNDDCPAEQLQEPYCVRVRAESGQLYRFRNVVRAGTDGDFLFVDRGGALCDRMSSAAGRICDR